MLSQSTLIIFLCKYRKILHVNIEKKEWKYTVIFQVGEMLNLFFLLSTFFSLFQVSTIYFLTFIFINMLFLSS